MIVVVVVDGVIKYHSGCDPRYVNSPLAPVSQFTYWLLLENISSASLSSYLYSNRPERGCREREREKKKRKRKKKRPSRYGLSYSELISNLLPS